MLNKFPRFAFAFALLCLAPNVASSTEMDDLYFVDAQSQLPKGLNLKSIIPLMDKAGVWHTILSAGADRSPQEVAFFTQANPYRMTAAVRSQGKDFMNNSPGFPKMLNFQLNNPAFRSFGEAILFRPRISRKLPRVDVGANHPQSEIMLDEALLRGWPFIAHYEFASAGAKRDVYMRELETMLRKYRQVDTVLINMGQLPPEDVRHLISGNKNIFFMMSRSNPAYIANYNKQPWVNMFDGEDLSSGWKTLILDHPDRFVVGLDNTWLKQWDQLYMDQTSIWRAALKKLPNDVAVALAHGNAERLWDLPPRP
ncbi:MAG: hypothetical protein JKY92_04865 [Magnetovibrio sp.]|nr:hypothetical protein [Magnetovibrio sp.]